jgi:hypothetical protein
MERLGLLSFPLRKMCTAGSCLCLQIMERNHEEIVAGSTVLLLEKTCEKIRC